MPWRDDLGGPRVQIELADELRRAGHTVDKFSWEDATASGNPPRHLATLPQWFAAKAHRYIRAVAPDIDVIDAHQGAVTVDKASLGYSGALVARSVGLFHFYQQYLRRWDPHRGTGIRHQVGRGIETLTHVGGRRAVEKSFDVADRILVPNEAELDFLLRDQIWGPKGRLVPLPISTPAFRTLSAGTRYHRTSTLSFIGTWDPRKGSRDWPHLASLLWRTMPDMQLHLLGTGRASEEVLRSLGEGRGQALCVPHYRPEQLPGLLASVTVGVFPSYLEGYGLAVVEQLAAGIPVVAYDIPGPREILSPLDLGLLVRPGDIDAMAARVLDLLAAGASAHKAVADRCINRASELTWATWAPHTVKEYMGACRA